MVQPVGTPSGPTVAWSITPWSGLGFAVVSWNGSVIAMYTTYSVDPSGDTPGAEYSDRSPAFDTGVGELKEAPPSVDHETIVVSLPSPSEPSLHATKISSVASSPVGAPLAMSTLGIAERSMRCPAIPSATHRRVRGSTSKQGSVIGMTSCGFSQLWPPLKDRISVAEPSRLVPPKWVKNA